MFGPSKVVSGRSSLAPVILHARTTQKRKRRKDRERPSLYYARFVFFFFKSLIATANPTVLTKRNGRSVFYSSRVINAANSFMLPSVITDMFVSYSVSFFGSTIYATKRLPAANFPGRSNSRDDFASRFPRRNDPAGVRRNRSLESPKITRSRGGRPLPDIFVDDTLPGIATFVTGTADERKLGPAGFSFLPNFFSFIVPLPLRYVSRSVRIPKYLYERWARRW